MLKGPLLFFKTCVAGGEQRVVVEYVYVVPRGQAIVGAVTHDAVAEQAQGREAPPG
jgi:hypothetical protein